MKTILGLDLGTNSPERDKIMPIKELKGVERISLKRGESRKVTIRLKKFL